MVMEIISHAEDKYIANISFDILFCLI